MPAASGERLEIAIPRAVVASAAVWDESMDQPTMRRGAPRAELAVRLADSEVSAVSTSPLPRARETSAVVSSALGVNCEALEDLRELPVGDLDGQSDATADGHDDLERRPMDRRLTIRVCPSLTNRQVRPDFTDRQEVVRSKIKHNGVSAGQSTFSAFEVRTRPSDPQYGHANTLTCRNRESPA